MTTPPQLDRFISLSQAARRLGLTKDTLRSLVDLGKVKGAILPNGQIGVNELELDQTVTREQFEQLRGQAITISEAARKYGIGKITFRQWTKRGYIRVLKEGYGMELDEADVAYCAAVYQVRGGVKGKRLFDELGQPYQYKHTEWAAYQRERRKKNQANPVTTKRPRT